MEKNLFELAARGKYRYPYKGIISTEDLWDLTVKELDAIYKNLNADFKKSQEESLLETRTVKDQELENKVEIIKYIVKVKLEEAEKIRNARAKKEQKQKILTAIAEKEDQALSNMSIEELKKLAEEM
jgi:uncharacterized protein YktB (UPF0637 family)